jgi:hypothetical protein
MLSLNKLRHVISENLKRGEERKRKHRNHSGQCCHQQVSDILESACRLYRQLWSCGSKQYTGKKTIKEEILRVTAKKNIRNHMFLCTINNIITIITTKTPTICVLYVVRNCSIV